MESKALSWDTDLAISRLHAKRHELNRAWSAGCQAARLMLGYLCSTEFPVCGMVEPSGEWRNWQTR